MAGEGRGHPVETRLSQDLDKARRFLSIHRGTVGSLERPCEPLAYIQRESLEATKCDSRMAKPSEAISLNRNPFHCSVVSERVISQ